MKPPTRLRVCKAGEVGPPRPGPTEYAPLPLTTDHSKSCQHERSKAFPGLRKIVCQGCGADLDAFDVVLKLSREFDKHQWARDEHAKLRREIEGMEVRVRNLKAQKRRAEQ